MYYFEVRNKQGQIVGDRVANLKDAKKAMPSDGDIIEVEGPRRKHVVKNGKYVGDM